MVPDPSGITPLDAWIGQKAGLPDGKVNQPGLWAYQLDRINSVIAYAKSHSKYYPTRLKNVPESIQSQEEFSRFPFTSSLDLQDDPTRFICVSQNDIARVVTFNTSGTTGQSKRCFFTPEDLHLTVDFFGVGMSTLVSCDDRVLILLPDKTPDSVGDLLYRGLLTIGAVPFKHGPVKDLDETLHIMSANRINNLVGVPTQVLALVRRQQTRPDQFPVDLKSILLSTDYVPEAITSVLETAWKCKVFNHYGMTEMGLGGGVFCSGQYGYHLREADLYFEIIDPCTGQLLPDGETGEVVFTTLTRTGMPLIRYRTGDLSRFLPGPCPCGSTLKSLEKIKGRLSGSFKIGPLEYRIADLDEALFHIPDLINYRLSLTHSPDSEHLSFRLFYLDQPAYQPEREVRAALMSIGLRTEMYSLFCEILTGFPDELTSLAKRKVIEN